MIAYWKAVAKRVPDATYDVIFVAFFSLAPLLLGRLALAVRDKGNSSAFWDFLYNGQLTFFSLGSLAALLLICFRGKLPRVATLIVGLATTAAMLFICALVVIDPTLQQGQSFVGSSALIIYIIVLVVRILADAMKVVDPVQALDAGSLLSSRFRDELVERMKGGAR